MSEQMQQIVLKQYCDGPPKPEDFDLVQRDAPIPNQGQFRVRHIWNSVDPGTRSRLSGGDSYAAALPLGKPIDGFSVGIVDASEHEGFPVGTKVFCAGHLPDRQSKRPASLVEAQGKTPQASDFRSELIYSHPYNISRNAVLKRRAS